MAALAAGCGSSSSGPASSVGGSSDGGATTPPPSSTPTSSTQTSGGSSPSSGGSTGGGTTGSIPKKTTETPAATKLGTTIVITPTGFSPHVLIAPLGIAITWENESGRVQSVHLDNFSSAVDSGPIQPGHAWRFNPRTASSIIYHSTYDPSFKAQLQVQAVGNY